MTFGLPQFEQVMVSGAAFVAAAAGGAGAGIAGAARSGVAAAARDLPQVPPKLAAASFGEPQNGHVITRSSLRTSRPPICPIGQSKHPGNAAR